MARVCSALLLFLESCVVAGNTIRNPGSGLGVLPASGLFKLLIPFHVIDSFRRWTRFCCRYFECMTELPQLCSEEHDRAGCWQPAGSNPYNLTSCQDNLLAYQVRCCCCCCLL